MKIILALSALVFAANAQAKKSLAPPVEFVPGEYVAKLKNNKTLLNTQSLGLLSNAGKVRVINKEEGLVVIKRNMLEVSSYSINALKNNSEIEYVEPNYIYRKSDDTSTPNDPRLSDLWGLSNTGQQVGSTGTGREGVDVDALRSWYIQTGSRDVVVAVIDTGLDYTIADLAPNSWTNEAELNGEAGVDDDGNGYVDDIHGYDFANGDGDPMDDHGHGSHCAGTIGAKGDDTTGVVGVNWNVSVMGIKFLTGSGSGTLENAVKSIDYATTMGVDIMSNSWGGGGFSQALEDAIQRANDKGIIFIAAAGNHNANNDEQATYPANYDIPNVISVAAINNKGNLASFSCYGKTKVHLAAPGVDILSTTPAGFKSWSGTSMATPHVSGVAALVIANEPNISMSELKERLISSARPIAGLRNRVATGGIVNAYHALTNTVAPFDPEDPFHWMRQETEISTEHPYPDGFTQTWEVSVEGAERVAVHFSQFETEGGYDTVTFKNKEGQIIDVWSGNVGEAFSPAAIGDTLIIVFKSDRSMNRHGFDIDAVAVKGDIAEDAIRVVKR